jgi:hypothetical protein
MRLSLPPPSSPHQALSVTTAIAAIARSAASLLSDDAKASLLDAARSASLTLATSSAQYDTSSCTDFVSQICMLLGASMPTDGTARRRSFRSRALAASSGEALKGMLEVARQLGGTLARETMPDGTFVSAGDGGVYISAVALPQQAGAADVQMWAGENIALPSQGRRLTATTTPPPLASVEVSLTPAAASTAAGWSLSLAFAPSALPSVEAALSAALPSGTVVLAGLASVGWHAGSSASPGPADVLPSDGSYLLVTLPAPGYNASRWTSCALYNASNTVPLQVRGQGQARQSRRYICTVY